MFIVIGAILWWQNFVILRLEKELEKSNSKDNLFEI